jgi:hypothetical protein
MPKSGAVMQRHQPILSVAVALALWAAAVHAAPPEMGGEVAQGPVAEPPAPMAWVVVEARNHASGTSGLVAVSTGVAQERGHRQTAVLRVYCLDERTIVRVDVDGLGANAAVTAVRQSLDRGPFVTGAWQLIADGSGLALSGDQAIAFLTELYGRTELRLAVVRPLSVPFVLIFDVDGAEMALRPLADRYHWSSGPAISDAGR